jgi:aspartyl-tRNA(Asn)/glutamyl-tRNA(Gln) amidotransferase subunit A
MYKQTVAELSKGLADKKFSSVELTSEFLARIKSLDKNYNSFISVTEELALEQAKQADELISSGKNTPLTGIPLAQKDIFCTQGVKTSCGSKMLDNFISPYNATVIDNFNQQHAVMLGKTNMDEFAMGSSNETSWYGCVKNPWDVTTVPGGSSGGSAAAVAACLAAAATGTDTGGSIRQPASLCGITGLKPTYGRVSRYGMIAFASSLDQAGPMAKSALDCAMLLNTMASFDKKDSTCVNKEVPDYTSTLNNDFSGLKIGLPKEYFSSGLNPEVEKVVQEAIKTYEKLGAEIKEISLPNTHLAAPAYYIIAPSECSSNLSRYDGVRYGYRCEDPKNLDDLYIRTRGEGFGAEVKRRILVGTYALSEGFYDAYYVKAQKIRRLISDDFKSAFNQVDVIMGPTAPTTAFKLGEKTDDPLTMYLSDIYTIAVNLAGLPGLSIPAGFVNNLPVGLQLIGNYFDEQSLLNIAHQFQLNTDFHTKLAVD